MFSITSIIKRVGRLELATILSLFAVLLGVQATAASAAILPLPDGGRLEVSRTVIAPAPTSGTVPNGTTTQIAKVVSSTTKGHYNLACGVAAGADNATSWDLRYVSDVSDGYSVTTSGTSTQTTQYGSQTRSLDSRTVKSGIGSSVITQLGFAFGADVSLSANVTSKVQGIQYYWFDAKRFTITKPLGGGCQWSFAAA